MLALSPVAGGAQRAEQATDVGARLARADSAWEAGDSRAAEAEYAAVVALDAEQSRAVYRLAELRRGRDLDAAIALYRRYAALEPLDAWGYLALGKALADRGDFGGSRAQYDAALRLAPRERDAHVQRARMLARAGFAAEAARAYRAWLAISPDDAESRRELARARRRAAAWVEPVIGGTRDSDAITTWHTGVNVASPDMGRARLLVSGGRGAAGDAVASRGSANAHVGAVVRPASALTVELSAGAQRVDRSFIDPAGGSAPGAPRAPIGRAPGAGESTMEVIPVGTARLVWRDAMGRLRIDARASRRVLDASPYLIAQGVRRDEIGGELDLRVAGPLRARVFGRIAAVHNEAETNERRIVGGAIAWAPRNFDVSLRGQELSYGAPTGLAYFAPRYVRTLQATAYLERELGDVQLAVDLGAGSQQAATWTEPGRSWSPAVGLWAQVARPLTPHLTLGGDVEAYDARIGTDMPALATPVGRWRYGALRIWMRAAM